MKILIVIYLIIGFIIFITPHVYIRKLDDYILNEDEVDPMFAYNLLLYHSFWDGIKTSSKIIFSIIIITLYPVIIIFLKFNK